MADGRDSSSCHGRQLPGVKVYLTATPYGYSKVLCLCCLPSLLLWLCQPSLLSRSSLPSAIATSAAAICLTVYSTAMCAEKDLNYVKVVSTQVEYIAYFPVNHSS